MTGSIPSAGETRVASMEPAVEESEADPAATGISEPDRAGASDESLGDDLRRREFRIILQILRDERGRRKQAAERLGISPRTLRYKLAQMRDYGINPEEELALA